MENNQFKECPKCGKDLVEQNSHNKNVHITHCKGNLSKPPGKIKRTLKSYFLGTGKKSRIDFAVDSNISSPSPNVSVANIPLLPSTVSDDVSEVPVIQDDRQKDQVCQVNKMIKCEGYDPQITSIFVATISLLFILEFFRWGLLYFSFIGGVKWKGGCFTFFCYRWGLSI